MYVIFYLMSDSRDISQKIFPWSQPIFYTGSNLSSFNRPIPSSFFFPTLLLPHSKLALTVSSILFYIHGFNHHRCYSTLRSRSCHFPTPPPASHQPAPGASLLSPPAWSSWTAHPAASASTARWPRSAAAGRRNRRPPTAARLRLTGASSRRRELSTAHVGSARPGGSVGVFAKERRNSEEWPRFQNKTPGFAIASFSLQRRRSASNTDLILKIYFRKQDFHCIRWVLMGNVVVYLTIVA